MAQNDAITFFPEIERVCRKLNNEQFGVLIRAVIAYRLRGEVYIGDDVRVDACFEFLSNQVDREDAAKAKKAKAAASRWDKEQMHRDAEACTPMHRDAEACTPMHRDANDAPIPSNPIPSHPVPSDPIPSHPIPSHPIQNVNSLSDEREYRRGGAGSLPGKAKKEAFGKFGRVKLTPEEYAALEQELGTGELRRCIDYVDECAQATNNRNKWKDYSVILTRCSREGWGVQQEKRAQEIPKGASGVLGEAELEAIQLLLKEDNYAGTP